MGNPEKSFIDVHCPGADPEADEALIRDRFSLPDDGRILVSVSDPGEEALDSYHKVNSTHHVTVEDSDPATPLNCPRFENGSCRTLLPTEPIVRPIIVSAAAPEGGFPVGHKLEVFDRDCRVKEVIRETFKNRLKSIVA